MSGGAELPQDARPLRLVPGYLITPDGRVFRAKDGEAVTPLSLREAKRFAAADIAFDANRHRHEPPDPKVRAQLAKLNALLQHRGFEPEELQSLVYTDPGGEVIRPDGSRLAHPVEMVQCVRRPSKDELKPRFHGDGFAVSSGYMGGHPMVAAGDTTRLWYLLQHDGAKVLFHGPSLAAQECSQ